MQNFPVTFTWCNLLIFPCHHADRLLIIFLKIKLLTHSINVLLLCDDSFPHFVKQNIFSILNTTFQERVCGVMHKSDQDTEGIWPLVTRTGWSDYNRGRVRMHMPIYVCLCESEWGVVVVFTVGNEAISRLPRGDMGVSVRGMGVVPIFPFPKCGSLTFLWLFFLVFL